MNVRARLLAESCWVEAKMLKVTLWSEAGGKVIQTNKQTTCAAGGVPDDDSGEDDLQWVSFVQMSRCLAYSLRFSSRPIAQISSVNILYQHRRGRHVDILNLSRPDGHSSHVQHKAVQDRGGIFA